MNKPVIAGIIFVVVVLVVVVYSSFTMNNKVRAEVCMEYGGRTICKTVSGDSQEHVLRTASENACAELTGGVTDSMACERATPKCVTWKGFFVISRVLTRVPEWQNFSKLRDNRYIEQKQRTPRLT